MVSNSVNFFFRHSKIAFLTKHKKEIAVSPLVKNYLGTEIELVSGFDTDELGTFTREKKRNQSQIETARIKAEKAIELSGCSIGMGSEGSFCTDPYVGMMPWNTEMIVLLDKKNGIEIVGIEQRAFKSIQKAVKSKSELEKLLIDLDFPNNNLILRPNHENDPLIIKDFVDEKNIFQTFQKLIKSSDNGLVFVENDHRAHRSVSRMESIKFAAVDLMIKCHSLCPDCSTPGFWVNRGEGGLPCEYCGEISESFQFIVYKCTKCLCEKKVLRTDVQTVSQQYCSACNP